MKLDAKELTNRLYDTLMGNVGFSKFHLPFPADRIKNQWVGSPSGKEDEFYMYFEIGNKAYKLEITETQKLR